MHVNFNSLPNKLLLCNTRTNLIALLGLSHHQMADLYVLDEISAKWTKIYSIGTLASEGLQIPQCFSTGDTVLTWTGKYNHASNRVFYFCNLKTNLVRVTQKLRSWIRRGMNPTPT